MTARLTDPRATRPAPHHHPARDTEAAAAALVTPVAGSQRATALDAFVAADDAGLTDCELADRTGLYLYSAAPRRNELVRDGWLIDSGIRRLTHRRRNAVVWVLSPEGRDRLSA